MKTYLGDGVYADFDGYGIILTTENGIRATNNIYLEPQCFEALNRFVERLRDSENKATPMDEAKS